jgi:hypothetical protein
MLDAEFVEQGLRLEVSDPDRGGFAVLHGPMLADLDRRVCTRDPEIDARHDLVVFCKQDVVAEPTKVEDIRQVPQYLITKERGTGVYTASGQIVGCGRREVRM